MANQNIYYELGQRYPYDDSNEGDWAAKAARGVIADLTDRRNIKHGFDDVDPDVRVEIVQQMAEIIRLAWTMNG